MLRSLRVLSALLALCVAASANAGTLALQFSLGLHTATAASDPAPAQSSGAVHLKLAERASDSLVSDLVLRKALAMLGTDYEFGSNDDDAVDCSALVQQAFRSAGLELPRTTRELLTTGTSVKRSQLRAGDLMIYRWKRRQLHVAVYLDDGYIVHASPSAGEVVVTELNERWQRRLVAVRRLL